MMRKPVVAACTVGLAGAMAWFTWLAGCGSGSGLPDDGIGDPTPPSGFAPFTFSLRIARHVDQGFSDDLVDTTLSRATTILQTVQTDCVDVATPVTFVRSGDVRTFDSGSAFVTTEAQLDRIFEEPGDIKIVTSMIGVCGPTEPGDVSVLLGCASTGGSVVITHHADPDIWAHEWGHVLGLDHRDDCPHNLMHTFELDTNAVNTAEALAFLAPTGTQTLRLSAAIQAMDGETALARSFGESLRAWLGRIVARRYLAGVPAAILADVHDEDSESVLLEMLREAPDPNTRKNLIRALGLIGGPAAIQAIVDSTDGITGVLSTDEFAACAETFLALGRLAADDDSGLAVDLLQAGTKPETWALRNVAMRGRSANVVALHDVFARLCLMGLGLSGEPAARQHLLDLKNAARTGRRTSAFFDEQLDEALARLDGTGGFGQAGSQRQRQP